jgi:hypothetical protein
MGISFIKGSSERWVDNKSFTSEWQTLYKELNNHQLTNTLFPEPVLPRLKDGILA